LASLDTHTDIRNAVDHRLVRLRSQVAIIRTLADDVDAGTVDAGAMADQVIEEMARLGCRLLEMAATLATAAAPEDSGAFARIVGRA
jgi:hypothetical protein